VSGANCLACHDPHSSQIANLIMPNQHAPFKGGKCRSCHKPNEGGSAFDLVSDIKSVCTRCHSTVRIEAEGVHSHNLNDDRSCMNCHNAHASSGEALLAGDQQTLCPSCHFKGREYAGKSRESLLTHDAMECTSCHQPHGSENVFYLRDSGVDLCVGCHERAHRSAHPLGPEIIDPRTGKPVTCRSCHKLHGADYEPYLPLSPEMDLCIQCHKR
jgi:predicted CXXCH cytochrome family protein